MKLISMTNFVLEQNNFKVFRNQQILNYANFLKQPLELWMFVPCDENDKIMIEPNDYMADKEYFKKYQQAKERCLFVCEKDLEFNYNEICGMFTDIEDVMEFEFELTQTAIKQLGL